MGYSSSAPIYLIRPVAATCVVGAGCVGGIRLTQLVAVDVDITEGRLVKKVIVSFFARGDWVGVESSCASTLWKQQWSAISSHSVAANL